MKLSLGTIFFGLFTALALLISWTVAPLSQRVGGAYAVNDLTGRSVRLYGSAKKAMIFTPIIWHYVTVDQSDQNIHSIAPFMAEEIKGKLLTRIFPGLTEKNQALAVAGAIPLSTELILLARPDVVVSWAHFSGELSYVKYPGLILIPSNFTIEGLYPLLAQLTNKYQRVDYLDHRFQERLLVLTEHLPSLTSNSPTALALSSRLVIMGRNFINLNRNFERVNIINAASNLVFQSGSLNIEALLALNPDLIFLSFVERSLKVDDIYQNPLLMGLKAVKQRRVYRFPKGLARMEGPVEEPILASWMKRLAYPDLTGSLSLRRDIKKIYWEFFHYEMSEEEIDELLELPENRFSAHYEQFFGRRED
jgi:iron complex transport system substrate-binding protein